MAKYLTLFSAIHWKKRSTAKRRGKGRVRRRRRGDDLVAPSSSVLYPYSDLKKISFFSLSQGKAMAPEIPLDLQIEILKRLPSKSLMRFKCVSKLWSFLIRSRYFSNLYLTAGIPPRQPCLYMSLLEHDECDSLEVCQNPGKTRLLALSSSCNGAESLEPFLTIEGMGGHKMVSLRGLILYTVCRKACIYNPATRQSVTLPAVKSIIFGQVESPNKYVQYFLGHDPVLDQYKVVCNVVTLPEEDSGKFEKLTSEHWVFVLEAGGSWKKIEFDQTPHFCTRRGLCINGVIYYLACTRTACQIVMSFDVRSEEFKMIQAPQPGESKGFIEYDGKPTIVDYTYIRQNGLVDLWVMEDGGNWSKKSLVLQASQMHLVKNDSIEEVIVECTTQKGEIILVPKPCPSRSYFLYYDMQKNDLRKVNVSGILGQGFSPLCFTFRHMDQSESIMHLEI